MSGAQVLRGPRLQEIGLVGQRADVDLYTHHDERNFPHGGDKAQGVWRINVEAASASAGDVIGFEIEGYPVSVVSTGTLATDLTNLRDAILADPIANGFVANVAIIDTSAVPAADDSLEITLRTAGYGVEIAPLTGRDADVTIERQIVESFGSRFPFGRACYLTDGLVTLTKPAGNIEDVLLGISLYDRNRESDTIGQSNDSYSQRRDVNVALSGRVVVEGGDDATFGAAVYVGTTANAELGKFFTAAGAGRTLIPRTVAQWAGPSVVQIRLGL